jgi:hypothetical protein
VVHADGNGLPLRICERVDPRTRVAAGIEVGRTQVPLLRSVGFTVGEVADMLGMQENHVRVADHHGRKKRKAS